MQHLLSRRSFNVSLLSVGGASAFGSANVLANAADQPEIASTKINVPNNACDSHIHIFDERFPAVGPTEPNSRVADYRQVMRRMGTSRTVIVTPRPYRTDNRCTLDAIAQLGIENARGIAVLHPEVSDAELRQLSEGGIRGIRFTLHTPALAVTDIGMVDNLSRRVADLGWHVQVHMRGQQLVEHEELLGGLTSPLVLDHMGRMPQPEGIHHKSLDVVRRLLDRGRTWIKLSGPYQESKTGAPRYSDIIPVAQALIKHAPERMVWGSDWPHTTERTKPDAANLMDLLAEWAPDQRVRNRILVDNPAALYGFKS